MAGLMRLPNGNYVDPTKVVAVYTDDAQMVFVLLNAGDKSVSVVAFDYRNMPEMLTNTEIEALNAQAKDQIVRDVADLNGWVQKNQK